MMESAESSIDIRLTPWPWLAQLRPACIGEPMYLFFPHAGGSPLSAGAFAAALPQTSGVMAVNLPRVHADGPLPKRVTQAVGPLVAVIQSWLADSTPHPQCQRLLLVGNSYGALLAYEVARQLTDLALPVERLIVSGFRSPAALPTDTPLYRLPSDLLYAELRSRFGSTPRSPSDEHLSLEEALRADLEACDTYRHAAVAPLPIPVEVLHMIDDPSISLQDLQEWQAVTAHPLRVSRVRGGHFPWATEARTLAPLITQLLQSGDVEFDDDTSTALVISSDKEGRT